MEPQKKKNWVKIILKWVGIVIGSIILLLVILWFVLQTRWAQNIVRKEIVNYLEKKLDTKVNIARLSINYLYHLELDGVYIEDRAKEPLVYIGKLEAGYRLLDLLDNTLTISGVQIDSLRLNIHNSETDSLFNYDFITRAFASADTTKTADTLSSGTAMKFNLGDIELSRANLHYNDAFNGQNFTVTFSKVDIGIDRFNLDSMDFRLDHLYTQDLAAGIRFKPTPNVTAKDTTPSIGPMPLIRADSVLLTGTRIIYIDDNSAIDLNTVAAKLGISDLRLNLNTNNASINSLSLADHSTTFTTNSKKPDKEEVAEIKDSLEADPFKFTVEHLALQNNTIQYDDVAKPGSRGPGIDFSHMRLNNLNTSIRQIISDGVGYKAGIESLTFNEKSGFRLKQFRTNAIYDEQQVKLDDIVIQTNRTLINGSLEAGFESIEEAGKNPGQVSLNAVFSNTSLVLNDLLYIQPALAANKYVQPLLNKIIQLNTRVNGKVNNLNIPQLMIRQGSTALNSSARVTGLPDAKKMKIDLRLNNFSGTREGLLSLLPRDLIPSTVHIPETFSIRGTYDGTPDDMKANINVVTSSGDVTIAGKIKNASDSLRAVFDAHITSANVQLNKFLGDTSMGKASVDFKVKGRGYAVKTADITLDGIVNKLEAKGYTYNNIKVKGRLANNKVVANLNSPDSNLLADIDVSYNMDETNPELKANSNDMRINLQKLGFVKEHLIVKAKLNVDLINADPDNLDGDVFITGLQIAHKDRVYPLDSLKLIAGKVGDSSDITIESPMLFANMRGLYKVSTVGQSIQAVMSHYMSDSTFSDTSVPSNQFRLTGTVNNHPIIRSFVPDVRRFTPLNFAVNMNSENYLLQVVAGMKTLRYADFIVDSFNLVANSQNDSLLYGISLKQVTHPTVPLYKTAIYGGLRGGNVGWNVDLHDKEDKDKYFLGGTYNTVRGVSELRLLPELLINQEKWTTNQDNLVQLDSNGIKSANLELMQGSSGLKINGTGAGGGYPISLQFMNFSIATIASMIQSDTLVADGLINGSVQLKESSPFSFVADLSIDSIKAFSQKVGTLKIDASNSSPEVYNVNAVLTGDSVNLTVKGDYTTSGENNLNFDINIPEFSLRAAQPFVKDILANLSGLASGNITLRGSSSKPQVRGSLSVKQASMIYSEYGTSVRIPDETIVFDEQGILLDKFTITDSLGHEAVVDGRVFTTDYQVYRFDLSLNAREFRAVDNRLRPEQTIFGPASINARLTIKGDMNLPVIEGRVRVIDNSSITFVLPSKDPQVESRRGIIQFVDFSNPVDSTLLANTNPKDTLAEDVIKGLSLSISAEITPESSLTIVLDEDNGDSLRVNGAATINMTIDPSGKTSMTGRYTVSEGAYILSLNQFIKRKFDIVKDGTITWTGDPTSATIDLAALYTVNTTAEPLLNATTSVPQGALRQKLPFLVYLNLEGEMLQPRISFKLDMPERERNIFDGVVYNRIKLINNDESELNKQVMGLLVLNNFIGNNPFSSLSSNTSAETIAVGAAGKILAQQLNNLAGDLIKGVDVNFDFEQREDFTSGTQQNSTRMNVGVSKSLFNDRTTVTLGTGIPVEGSSQSSSGLTGNVTIDYKITRDGRYRLKIYRRNDNQSIIDGEVLETGVGFTLVMDYNEFKEIFQKSRRDRRYRNQVARPPSQTTK
ncbi:MAG: translocation/assembly module TamB [Chitinophagaceae bacterium]|nr:MAG: translocation/assembly module TamB [Chitinophagaceae bacterium]